VVLLVKLSATKMYYTISEVCALTNLKPHVLRYWEDEFPVLAPPKNRAGNRAYRVKDIKFVFTIKHLLYDEGYTIAGARKKLQQIRRNPSSSQLEMNFEGALLREVLTSLRSDLKELLVLLRLA
jgi:DNA-binding transcriptional MerR regulator